jgi:general secretion pathway protein H
MLKRLGTGNARSLHRRSAGFTLLELLVVLAIMVIAVTAFPLVLDRALPGRRVRAATEHLEAAIRDAEIQSIALDQPQRLSVSELTSQFGTSTHLRANGPGGGSLRAVVTYPDGSTNGARFVVSDGPDQSTVVVGEITGRISVEPR